MKVQNLTSSKGNTVPNQFEITIGKSRIFQSYKSIIARIDDGVTFLDERYWNYSRTTSKYRSQFLGESTAVTQNKINRGEYILTDLNSEPVTKPSYDFKFLK